MMDKRAAQHIKLAHFAGTAQALGQFGFPAQTVYSVLMEKGASAAEAEMITKQAFGMVAKGIEGLAKLFGGASKGLGAVAKGGKAVGKGTQLALPGMEAAAGGAAKAGLGTRLSQWGSGMMGRGQQALTHAAEGMKTDPWGTMGRGALGVGHGMLLGGGKGVGATVGKGILGGTVASSILGGGGGGEQQPQNYGMQPQYGGGY